MRGRQGKVSTQITETSWDAVPRPCLLHRATQYLPCQVQQHWHYQYSYAPAKISVEERKVVSILSKLHPKKASGPDGLKGFVWRECAVQLGHVVAQLFQQFLAFGSLPRAWKETTIIHTPKKNLMPKQWMISDLWQSPPSSASALEGGRWVA